MPSPLSPLFDHGDHLEKNLCSPEFKHPGRVGIPAPWPYNHLFGQPFFPFPIPQLAAALLSLGLYLFIF